MQDVSAAAAEAVQSGAEANVVLATAWLVEFERALVRGDKTALGELFADECHWRDLLAFTWTVTQREGRAKIVDGLLSAQPDIRAGNFAVALNRTPPRRVKRVGVDVIET